MKKKVFSIALIGLFSLVNAQFPYTNSLQTTGTFTAISGGSTPAKVNASPDGVPTKGVLLTNATKAQFSGIELNGINFETDRGFNIDFEYFQWGGNNRGDGIALVLFDGSTTNPKIGVRGAGLGYTYSKRAEYGPNSYTNGFTDGYLAFGFDTFGNFHDRRSQGDDLRNGVVTNKTSTEYQNAVNTFSSFSSSSQPSYFTIRGSVDKPRWITGGTTSNHKEGYPVLYTVNTLVDGSNGTTVNGLSLASTNDGTHGSRYVKDFKTFDIRGGAYTENVKSPAYRKAYIQFRKGKRLYYTGNPDKNPSTATINEEITSYFADVYVESSTGREKIASNEQFRISAKNDPNVVVRNYIEPIVSSGWIESYNQWRYDYNAKYQYRAQAPKKLKMAFTASTGEAYQNQLVRNVNISLPFAPDVANDVFSNVCSNVAGTIGKPLSNDKGYNDDQYIERVVGTSSMPISQLEILSPIISQGNVSYLDSQTFAFMVLDAATGEFVLANPGGATPESHQKLDVPNLGTFDYVYKDSNNLKLDASEAYIRFTPKSGTPPAAGLYTIHYTIKNKAIQTSNGNPLGGDEYRSAVSLINVNIQKELCGKPYIITNKNVTNTILK